jgi:hypothetical protein
MGEAKRKRTHDTMDGGSPSDAKTAFQLEVFNPLEAMLGGDDRLRLAATREAYLRSQKRPTPVCGACDYEFGCGESPPLLYCTRPMFPKAENFQFICGAICPRCAARSNDELFLAIVGYLRKIIPDAEIAQMGAA